MSFGSIEAQSRPMDDKKIYLLAELTIRPEFLEEVKALLEEALIPTLQELSVQTGVRLSSDALLLATTQYQEPTDEQRQLTSG
jgi:hypothetical protein